MSKYMLRHDEASRIGCQAGEVHCKTNKNLGPGPAPCKIISVGPIDVGGQPRMRHVFMPCFHCEEPWCVKACPTGAMQQREKDGIVGSGPSSLAAAYYLRTYGHRVAIFEAQEKAGDMLRYGIPAYRLPPDLLEQELDQIRVLGIPIHTAAKVGRLADFRKNYDIDPLLPQGARSRERCPADSDRYFWIAVLA
jgi:ferredoxin